MIPKEILESRPQPYPYSIVPSSDHPAVYTLIREDTGAALGLTATEKRLVERLDGQKTLGEMIRNTIEERIAPLTALQTVLWDLHRYGFLKESPFERQNAPEGWGYWGTNTRNSQVFYIPSFSRGMERILGTVLLSPLFQGILLILFAAGMWMGRDTYTAIRMFSIHESFATALLVTALSTLAGFWIALWFGAMILRSLHSSPVRCLVDTRYALPLFHLDGTRLRTLSMRQAVHAALSPGLGLIGLSGLFLLLALVSQEIRQEGCIHIALGLSVAAFLSVFPWTSNLLSREITLRMRAQSVWETCLRTLRQAFSFFLKTRWSGIPHEAWFLAWGGWSLLSILAIVRLAAFLFRWEIPLLVSQILQEDNQTVLILLFILLATIVIAFLTMIGSLFAWIAIHGFEEIRDKYWPDHSVVIAAGIGAVWVLLGAYYFVNAPSTPFWMTTLPFIAIGGLLAILSAWGWVWNRTGKESWLYLLLLLVGVEISLHPLVEMPSMMRVVVYPLWILSLALFLFQFRSLWQGLWGNGSLWIVTVGLIFCQESLFAAPHAVILLHGPFWGWTGLSFLIGAYLLRISSLSAASMKNEALALPDESPLRFLVQRTEAELQKIYGALPKENIPDPCTPETVREYYLHLKKNFGSHSMAAMFRHASGHLPWHEAQRLAEWLPVSVKIPVLKDWTHDEIARLLANVPTFARLSQEELGALTAKTRFALFQPGERLIRQGEQGESMFILATGRVEVEVEKIFGKEIVAIFEPGDFTGEIGFLAGEKRTATVRALEPVIALCLHRADIDESTPSIVSLIHEARHGQSWLQALLKTPVFEEFAPALRTRVCLESHYAELSAGSSLWLEKEGWKDSLPIFLQGKGFLARDGEKQTLQEGMLLGLLECFENRPLEGTIKAEEASKVLLVDRKIFLEAIAELVLPID